MKLRNGGTDASRSTVWLVAAVLFGLPLLFLGWWGASKAFDSTTTTHYEASSTVQRVVLDTGDVNVEVREASVPAITVDTKSTYFIDKPDVTHRIDGTALMVKADCGSGWTMMSCDTDMTVTVPHGVSVSLDGSEGDVSLYNLTGKLAVRSGSGDVSGIGLLGNDVLALSTNGDVSLDLTSKPQRLDVSTDTGDIDVVVPSARYAVDEKSEEGDAELSNIVNDGSSERTIRSVSNTGDVSIAGRN